MWVKSLSTEDPLERAWKPRSSSLAWRILWTEKPGRLWSIRLKKSWIQWSDLAHRQERRVLVGSPEDSAFPLGKVGRSSSPVITEDVLVIYCCITNCPKYIILGNIRHLSSLTVSVGQEFRNILGRVLTQSLSWSCMEMLAMVPGIWRCGWAPRVHLRGGLLMGWAHWLFLGRDLSFPSWSSSEVCLSVLLTMWHPQG